MTEEDSAVSYQCNVLSAHTSPDLLLVFKRAFEAYEIVTL